jgi:hypothetical protein
MNPYGSSGERASVATEVLMNTVIVATESRNAKAYSTSNVSSAVRNLVGFEEAVEA